MQWYQQALMDNTINDLVMDNIVNDINLINVGTILSMTMLGQYYQLHQHNQCRDNFINDYVRTILSIAST